MPACRFLLVLLALAPAAIGQGITPYLNFETPVHQPLAVTSVGSQSYLLVCNAPDGSVEVYATQNLAFVARVPVGQEPVSIVVKPTPLADGGRRAYVTCWLGDSITALELHPSGSSLQARAVRNVHVGDEPIMMAFLPETPGDPATLPGGSLHESLLVTFSAPAVWGWFSGDTLAPVSSGSDRIELLSAGGTAAVKDPRAIAFSPASAQTPNVPGRLFVLNQRGGNDPLVYDLDLWSTDDARASAASGQATQPTDGGIGSTNEAMAFAPNGDLYVASLAARNEDPLLSSDPVTAIGEPIHRAMVTSGTGFVTSRLVRVRGAGTGKSELTVVDLNLQSGGQSATPVTLPTGVVVYGSGQPKQTRVFVTGFASDTIAMLEPRSSGSFDLTRIDVSAGANAFSRGNLGGVMRGPRSLALESSGQFGDSHDRLYVYNRIEHSISVLDPNFARANPGSAVLATFSLQRDPTPSEVKDGRKFLYSSRLSGGGNAACASCHIDGHTDFLAWNLSDGFAVPPSGQGLPGALGPNPAVKGPLTTQSLRGLVNFEVADDADQDQFFSNRPYHWRGDKGSFTDFNAAYVNLMAIPSPFFVDSQNPAGSKGIPDADMARFRRFVDSIHHSPNAEEPRDRRYAGSIGGGSDPYNDPSTGSGAMRGLKVYHIGADPMGNLTCVACHSLPEGGNRMLTDGFFYLGSGLDLQNLETTQLRGVTLKEKGLFRTDASGVIRPIPAAGAAVTGKFGLVHTGKDTMIFNRTDSVPLPFRSQSVLGFVSGFGMSSSITNDVALYVRQFDSGVAPIVGSIVSVDSDLLADDPGSVQGSLDLAESQARVANAGLAVQGRVAGVDRGFWFDVTSPQRPYTEQAHGGLATIGPFTRDELLALVDQSRGGQPGDLLAFEATPLGSERRRAFLDGGVPPPLATGRPSAIVLAPCHTNTANADVPKMTRNWMDAMTSGLFNTFTNNKTVIWYQASLMLWTSGAQPPGFGSPTLHHDAPRRLRVTGNGIRQGAWLQLYAPTAQDIKTATKSTPPTTTPTGTSNPLAFELPLHPGMTAQGTLVWETADEIEPRYLYGMLNGGLQNPVVKLALDAPNHQAFSQIGKADLFQPLLWNWWYVQVRNNRSDPTTFSDGRWQRLTIE